MYRHFSRRPRVQGLAIPTLMLAAASSVDAAAIGPTAFGPSAFTEGFTGYRFSPTPAPFVLNGATYTTSSGMISAGIAGDDPTTPTDAIDAFNLWTTDDGGWLDVVFDEPALRAGGWVLGSSGSVQFFDTAGSLLGTVAAPGPENNDWWLGSFAGWQTDALPIRRVRFNDVGNTGWTIGVDSVTWEPVPEPAAPLLFTAVLLLASRRRGVTAS